MKNNTLISSTFKNICSLFTFILLSLCATQVSAQRSLIAAALSKHGVDPSFLDPANLRTPVDCAFSLKESTITAGKTKVLEARFDPSATGREQWKVISVNGKAPSLYETNTFRNTREKPPVDKPDEATYKIDTETAERLVVSYKIDAASIPKDAVFLRDCRAVLTVDLRTKQLLTLQLVNEKPVKIGPLTAKKFEIVTTYSYDKQSRRYFPLSDILDMEAAFLGKTVTTRVENVYSGYSK
ncbi:hypothetical protein LJ707_02575 [Mucilaginibacter sp. UR6-1]|uniref:hypothetical protein n=1 Tax=Mucilaginibacter sp. UR6-1 TaxID=1435643 RepID=UPI001E44ECA0|nr:hypothetical protein [Mucilaginibacter sp. UR6-1]MCC8407798.1 hypothetical protein [Mucilaginibacter sp. UR6-1]